MAFPGDGVESAYRNWIDDVAAMLEQYHGGHYMIFNLSGRDYDYTKFRNNVQSWCSFPDHHPPPLPIMLRLLQTIHTWLLADPLNIIAVHCLAGKGRTGTVIASYLLYCGLFANTEEALNYFACKRSLTINGVTVPSQRRYVNYVRAITM
jgi:protein-tyrosine phosphatase